MKKVISVALITLLSINSTFVMADDVFRGHAEKTDTRIESHEKLFTGEVDTLDKKDVIEMTVSQVIDASFSYEGDEFFAEVTSDVSGDSGVIIPKGTVAHGIIKESSESRRLGRDGYITLDFDYLITPEGREIPIEGHMSTKLHPLKATTKIVATDLGYTALGGVVGGFMALNWLGAGAAVASNGMTVAGGAAIGGTVGLGMALYRKGKDVLISPGDQIKVKVLSTTDLPVYKEEALMQKEIEFPGLKVRISNIFYEKDPFGEANTITLTLSISNMSKTTFSGMDLALVSDYNSIYHPSVFGDTKIAFAQIKSGDRIAGKISFTVDNIKRQYWLTFYDRKTRKPVAKYSIDNAYKNVSEKTKKKNAKTYKKKNYYKEFDPFDESNYK